MARPAAASDGMIALKVVGLGHKITLRVPSTIKLAELKSEIENETKEPTVYQRLICHGKNLEASCNTDVSLELQDRTKILLLHNEIYAGDKEAYEQIQALRRELVNVPASMKDEMRHELATQICCKLDRIDIHGSDTLRVLRKDVLRQVEEMDPSRSS